MPVQEGTCDITCDISVYSLSKPGELCYDVQQLLNECPCAYQNETRQEMPTMIATYNSIFKDLANEWKQKNLTDFAVIIQPFLELCMLC